MVLKEAMFDKMIHMHLVSFIADKVLVLLMFIFVSQSAFAIEAQKPEISLAERILLENKIQREQFYGDVRLLHSPCPIDIQFSADGSVLFSLAETMRLWRSDTGEYLGSIVGPTRFQGFEQLNNSRLIVTLDGLEVASESEWYFGVPKNLPILRIWDVVTGECLAVRRMEIPLNATRVGTMALITVEKDQAIYVALQYQEISTSNEFHYQLLGFHGRNLNEICQIELDYSCDELYWDPHSNQLIVYGEYFVSGFDSRSKKIMWTKRKKNYTKPAKPFEEMNVIDQPVDIAKGIVSLRWQSALQKWHLRYEEDILSIDEKMIWSESADRICYIRGESEEINLFNAKTRKRVASPSGMVNTLSRIAVDNLSGSFDFNDEFVYQLKERERINPAFNTQVSKNSCIAISADAATLLVGDVFGKAHVWNIPNQKKTGTLTGVSKELLCISEKSSNKHIIAGDINGNFWQWSSPAQSESTQQLNAEKIKSPLRNLLFKDKLNASLCDLSSNGSLSLSFQSQALTGTDLLVASQYDPEEKGAFPGHNLVAYTNLGFIYGEVLATEDETKQTMLIPAVPHESVLIQIKSSENGRFVMFVFNTGQITIVDFHAGTLECIIQTEDKEIVDVDFLPDHKMLLVASYRGTVTAWNTESSIKTGVINLLDARLNLISSRAANNGYDLMLGTRDMGLIVKRGVFQKSN